MMTHQEIIRWFATADLEEVERVRLIVAAVVEETRRLRPSEQKPPVGRPTIKLPEPANGQQKRGSRQHGTSIAALCETILKQHGAPMGVNELAAALEERGRRTTVDTVRSVLYRAAKAEQTFTQLPDLRYALLSGDRAGLPLDQGSSPAQYGT